MQKRMATRSPVAVLAAIALMPFSAIADDGAPSLTQTTVLTGLESPWDMAFLDDGTMFFTEKCKGLSVRLPSGDVNALLGMTGTEGYATMADDLFCEGQAGMQGVAIDPNFAENNTLYVYSTSSMTAPGSNRLMRLTLSDDLSAITDRTDIVDDVPYKPVATDHPFGGPGAHNGGRVRFDPEGHLFLTTGDTHNGVVPQSPTLLGGKVLRLDTDGNGAEGNAPPEGFDARIFTYGHRNVQGIAFRPTDGQPVIAEHGPWQSDEINLLVNGGNFGWDPRPNMAGRGDCPDGYCGYMPNQMEGMDPLERANFMPMTDTATYPDAITPVSNNEGLSQGTSSAVYLNGEQWGDWDGKLAVGYLGIGFGGTPFGMRIDVVDIAEDGGVVHSITTMELPNGPTRVRSVVQGPDGDLYVAVDEGDIFQLSPN